MIMNQHLRDELVRLITEEFGAEAVSTQLAQLEAVPNGAPVPDWDEEDNDAVGTAIDYYGIRHYAS